MLTLALLITLTPVQVTAQEPASGTAKTNDKGIEMVYVPAGAFTMGSDKKKWEQPVRQVTVSGYWIGKNDVTVAQFRKFTTEAPYTYDWVTHKPSWGWKDDNPMVDVSWKEAQDFCKWAGGDLPTEAQWEKAARGTDGREYPWGSEFSTAKLWCSKSAFGDAGSTAPVGSCPEGASPYGCLDMAGNVWQWCLDWQGDYGPDETKNPAGPASGDARVLRGGSWFDFDPDGFRCAARSSHGPTTRFKAYGFRLAGRL